MKRLQIFVFCCILQSIHGSTDPTTNEISKEPNFTLFMVGGDEAPDGLAKYQCSYQINRRHFCGCAIMNSNFVLTASHCMVGMGNSSANVSILVGTNNLSEGGTYYEVEQLIPHEHFDDPDSANDIALVKINGSIEFNENVEAIELDRNKLPVGAELLLTGWGRMEANGTTPNDLRFVNLYVIGWDACNRTELGRLGLLHEGHFCTNGIKGTGVCRGDSGGPITYKGKLVGIVNIGIACALGIPDAYASISYYFDWITKHSSIPPQLAPLKETEKNTISATGLRG